MIPRVRLAALLRPQLKLLVVAFVAMLIEGATDLLEPWPLKVIFDYVIGSKPAPGWLSAVPALAGDRRVLLDAAAAAVVAIALVGAVSAYVERYLSTTVGQRVGHDLRSALYHHVQRLSLSFHDGRQTGDMVVRLTSDIDAVQDFISSVLLAMVLDVITLIGMLVVMASLDAQFTVVALSVAPLLFIVVYRLTRRIKHAAREVKRRESALASVVQEAMASIRVVKAFAREDYEEARLDDESRQSVEAALQARSIKARLAPTVDIIVAVGTALVLVMGARFVMDGRLSSGALLVFVLYLGRMYKPMKDLSKMTDTISKASVALDRVGEILGTRGEVADIPGAQPARALRGRIAFRGVTFGYQSERPVLHDVTFELTPGQSAALVGPTGSGKSTLIALVARLYDVTVGQVHVDGRDVRQYTVQTLRDQMSFVLQDAMLFRAPVWQNIAYGNPRAPRDAIVRAAVAANAHDFISALPEGYDTIVGERGATLSGGQRQRIAIARALVRDAPILFLDEPSAALDAESEELVFDALRRLTRGRTSITIAHRLATVRRADVILVLDGGRIVERGTHAALVDAGGLYSRLCRIQFNTRAA